MGFTDHCDVFASVHEDGFNQIIGHVRRQKPSLFNYATAAVAMSREPLLCREIAAHPIVAIRNNPLVTIVDPLPIPGTNYGVNFAVQLVDLRIDFHPGDEFNLPPQLAPLREQRLAIKLGLCGGIGCPPDDLLDRLIVRPNVQARMGRFGTHVPTRQTEAVNVPDRAEGNQVIAIPTRELICFCLDAYVTGGMRVVTYNGLHYLEPFVDGFEIVDITPTELENNLECYIGLMLKLVVLPGLRILLKHAPLDLTQGASDFFPQPTNVTLSPMPTSAALPNNPAIEQDQLKVFIKAEVN